MASELEFAGLQAWLRPPRVAVVTPSDDWAFHCTKSLQFLAQTWGGSQGVVLPADDGQLHPAVHRLAVRYDPDYVVGLQHRASDIEELQPGHLNLSDDGRAITDPAERTALVKAMEATGPQFLGPAVGDESLASIAQALPGFREEDGEPRAYSVHPSSEPPQPLAATPRVAEEQVHWATGDPHADLAVWMRTGVPAEPTEVSTIADGAFSYAEAMAIIASDPSHKARAPFRATEAGLTMVSSGRRYRLRNPVVVLGRGANDFALAMLLQRLIGECTWLPFDPEEEDWKSHVQDALSASALRSRRRGLQITSTSLDEAECLAQMGEFAAGELKGNYSFTAPESLPSPGRVGLRLSEVWDQRFSTPVLKLPDGSAEMVTTFPLMAPENLPAGLSGWIVQAYWPDRLIHPQRVLTTQQLIATDQNPYETFVRPSEQGLAFESGRFDWVPAGGSRFAQLAQPKLRWPSLLATTRLIAADAGQSIETSYAGTLSRMAIQQWGGRSELADDLRGPVRRLLNAFMADSTKSGPIDRGAEFDSTNTRVAVNKRCLVPFGALVRAAEVSLDTSAVREWLDSRVAGGTIQMGLALICATCRWADFYRIDDIGTRFECSRCRSINALGQARWKIPRAEPSWYYELNAPIVEFLRRHGDVPVLAVDQYARKARVAEVEFELEFRSTEAGKAQVEIDFAFMAEHGLVVGEAKSTGTLDGKKEADRVRDASKLFRAATVLNAQEVCFASAVDWSDSALGAIEKAAATSSRAVTVSVLEKLASGTPRPRRELHNPAGP